MKHSATLPALALAAGAAAVAVAPAKQTASGGGSGERASEVTAKIPLEPPKSLAAIRDEDWKSLQSSITYLFHKKRLHGLELDTLNEKVRNVRDSKIGQFIVEYYKDSILKKGMIVLREDIKEKKGMDLIERLSDVWGQFYREILPTLQAIFYPIQEQGIYIRSVTLVGFRDIVLLKTKIEDALQPGETVPSELRQMLLVLASIHDSSPPSENYLRLEVLVTRLVSPYMGCRRVHTEKADIIVGGSVQSSQRKSSAERKSSVTQTIREEMTRKFRIGSIGSDDKSRTSSDASQMFRKHSDFGSPYTERNGRNGSPYTERNGRNGSPFTDRSRMNSDDSTANVKSKTRNSSIESSLSKTSETPLRARAPSSDSCAKSIGRDTPPPERPLSPPEIPEAVSPPPVSVASKTSVVEESVDENDDLLDYFAIRNQRYKEREQQLQSSLISM